MEPLETSPKVALTRRNEANLKCNSALVELTEKIPPRRDAREAAGEQPKSGDTAVPFLYTGILYVTDTFCVSMIKYNETNAKEKENRTNAVKNER